MDAWLHEYVYLVFWNRTVYQNRKSRCDGKEDGSQHCCAHPPAAGSSYHTIPAVSSEQRTKNRMAQATFGDRGSQRPDIDT
jgi:hypothetical protein